MVVVENHGYDRVLVRPSDFYVVIGDLQFAYSAKAQSQATGKDWVLLHETVLFNGKAAGGWVIYQLPFSRIGMSAVGGDFSIVWDHPSDLLVYYYQKSTSSTE